MRQSADIASQAMTEGDAEPTPAASGAVIFVCTACRLVVEDGDGADNRPGLAFAAALREKLAGETAVEVRTVECLAVCKRPCTVALIGEGKWTYLVGDLSTAAHMDDVAAMARAYAASENGIVAWRERPQCFRSGVVARVPPIAMPSMETNG
jgi:predicted metal-binding protein